MDFNKGLFDLSNFNSDNFLLNESIDEFTDNDPSSHAGGDIDKDTTAAKQTSIPVPSKTVLSADVYNASLKALQKSFKEASEVLDIIANADVITESVDKDDKKSVKKYLTKLAKSMTKLDMLAKKDPESIKNWEKKRSKVYNKSYKKGTKLIDLMMELKDKYSNDKDITKLTDFIGKQIRKISIKYPSIANANEYDNPWDDLTGDFMGYARNKYGDDAVSESYSDIDTDIDLINEINESVDTLFDSLFENSDEFTEARAIDKNFDLKPYSKGFTIVAK